MSWTFQCPACGLDEGITGQRDGEVITLFCGACGHSWRRESARTCAACGSASVRPTSRIVLSLGRASVTSMTGQQQVLVCETCDAAAIERWTDRGHPLPPDYVTAAISGRRPPN
ncbi:MAG: hypothetical protein KJ776_15985 [Proteobacteria bacterium]|nr:hypothetical protein [Pseudomonadota bacterium]